jgi:hypothetical protein
MKQTSTAPLRVKTIEHWASFTHARGEADVARVHAFQAIVREHADLDLVTDDQITAAYGGRGWAPVPACIECGARDDRNVLFGPDEVSVCGRCLSDACALSFGVPPAAPAAPAPKRNLFSRLLGA